MKIVLLRKFLPAIAAAIWLGLFAAGAGAQPAPVEGDFVMDSFRFHTGESLPKMKVHYRTVGNPANEAVLVLHGTAGSGANMLGEGFANVLFGPGQPLDASRYFLILPDAIGTGKSTKPSDGLRTRFPEYNYDDMVQAQYRLVSEHLGIRHLRLVIGNSMGGMQTWLWGIRYPDFMDALVPLASLPAPMSGRNWMMRRMLIDSIVNDPAWKNGDYTEQPPNLRAASFWFSTATSGGTQRLQKIAPTSKAADAYIDKGLAASKVGDANDVLFQWSSSRDYDPTPDLDKIVAPLLAINAADDERNPPELGVFEREMKRIPKGRVFLIPASPESSGHGATGSNAALFSSELAAFLREVPQRATQ
jgi:homoserine O-acetyltransferase